ncbi:alpha/beta fold hydrolase [Streptomyces sp. WMMC500]|uniref:thioesterase II family protein n=1 Tax=Streptomyces sp. WMMC500 TaxID=3015154 RepID=UPI00248BC43A|nr:alpha/beta fold hydrolase [Streptomyces sp. WMMC500]WBB62051.1 alpha/beta fold hydrolase [Streptomyces sp. WMMC500]
MAVPWLLCRKRRPDVRLRLYCFPHSGASPGEYMRWSDELTDVEVVGVQAPGRGGRLTEPPFTRMTELVRAVVAEAEFAAPFAFFGHSLGALTAYEVAGALRNAGRPTPVLLVVSALGAPHVQPLRTPTHELTDEQMMAAGAAGFGHLPAIVQDDPEMLRIVLTCMRADAEILDTYRPTPGARLDVPVVALGGLDDDETAHLPGWADHSTHPLDLRILPGGHFYLREHHDGVLRIIRDSIRDVQSTADGSAR